MKGDKKDSTSKSLSEKLCTLCSQRGHWHGLIFPCSPAKDLHDTKKEDFLCSLDKKWLTVKGELKIRRRYIDLDHSKGNGKKAVKYMGNTQNKH